MISNNAYNEMLPETADKHDTFKLPILCKTAPAVLWMLLVAVTGLLVYYVIVAPVWNWNTIFIINGFTLLIWVTVLFFSAVVSTYAKTYLTGFKYHKRFTLLSVGFTLSVMTFVMSNHIAALLASWFIMGIFMGRLIGVDLRWKEAQEASKYALKFFIGSTLFLTIGMLMLAYAADSYTLNGILANVGSISNTILLLSALCIIVAAIIQSAIYPFHKWLLSAMTAPTPASALMHAGFVNGAGILLALVSVVLIASDTLTLLFIIGGLTAIIAQFTKLLQPNVKQKLACSTIAQMGFMIMQCGLGFFNAAVAHLILHGFYKAYLFLSSGEQIANSAPQNALDIKIKPFQAIVVLVFGAAGAFLFSLLTGKTSMLDSSIFLTLIVAITVGQITYNIVKEQSLSTIEKIIVPIMLFTAGIGLYALLYNGVTLLMADMPMVVVPQSLSVIQIVFGIVFLIGFFIMKLGVYRKVPWLYVKLLNASQPYTKTVLKYKNTVR